MLKESKYSIEVIVTLKTSSWFLNSEISVLLAVNLKTFIVVSSHLLASILLNKKSLSLSFAAAVFISAALT